MFFERRPALSPQAAYRLWANTYPPYPHNALMNVEQEAMRSLLRDLAPRRILDLGTGTGRYIRVLLGQGVPGVVGLDLNRSMLARARSMGAPLVRGDALRLPIAEASFDGIVASLMAGDVEDLRPWAEEAFRVLDSSGFLLYSDFHPSWSDKQWERTFETESGRAQRVHYYPHSLETHRSALESAGFRILRTLEPCIQNEPALVLVHAHKR